MVAEKKKNIQDEAMEEEKKNEEIIKKEVVIHSMPKRFLKSEPVNQKSKRAGALILVGAGVFLVAIIFLVYFFVFKAAPEEQPVVDPEKAQAEKKVEVEKEKKVDTSKVKEKTKKEDPVNQNSTSTEILIDKNTLASTTDEVSKQATTSKKTISAKKIEPQITNKLKDGADTDMDGLFDDEEILLSTMIGEIDSDGDGYDDFSELTKLYNPAGEGGILLNENIEKYLNSEYGFYFYYPKSWEVDKIDGNSSIIFKAKNNQFVQIIVQENSKNQSLEDWYKDQFNVARVEQGQNIYKKGWLAIENIDGLSVYMTNPSSDNIFVVTYSIGIDNILYYKNIYKMLVASMEFEK